MWTKKQLRSLYLVVLFLFCSQFSLLGLSSETNNMKTSDSSMKSSVRLQAESQETLMISEMISRLPKKYQEQLRKEFLKQLELTKSLERILIEQETLIEKQKTLLKSSDEEMKLSQDALVKIRNDLKNANSKIQQLKDEIVLLTEKLDGFNQSVKSELEQKDREILTWKIVGGTMITVSVVAIIGTTVVLVKKR